MIFNRINVIETLFLSIFGDIKSRKGGDFMNHNQAIELERIVRSVYDCDRAGMGGYIDADNFSSNPFDAALIALAPLWKNDSDRQVENFLYKWDHIIRAEVSPSDDSVKSYIVELERIVHDLGGASLC